MYLISFDWAWAKAGTRVQADVEKASAPASQAAAKAQRADRSTGRKLTLIGLQDIDGEPIYWALEDVFPLGTLSIMSGPGDLGKNTLLATWAKRIMEGSAEGDIDGRASVLTAVGEDDLGLVLKPRKGAAGYDPRRDSSMSSPSPTKGRPCLFSLWKTSTLSDRPSSIRERAS